MFFSHDRVFGVPGTFSLHRCPDCNAIFIQPWLNNTELAQFYPESYGRFRYSRSLAKNKVRYWRRFVLENYYGYPATSVRKSTKITRFAAWLLSFVTAKRTIPYRGTGRILDVGCGGGSYLYRLKQLGWEAYGVEPNVTGAQQAQRLGLDVRCGMLEDAKFENKFFDVIRLDNVLEHLLDPVRVLREIHRILKEDGLVYLIVPNTRSLVFWLFQENWYALDSPRHVISYSPKTLDVLCQGSGFKIAHINFAGGSFNFVRSMKYFLETKGTHWPKWIRNIRWDRNKFIRRSLKPFFFVVDVANYGDFVEVTLCKSAAHQDLPL
jgi:SAM-dependent methyltransferase